MLNRLKSFRNVAILFVISLVAASAGYGVVRVSGFDSWQKKFFHKEQAPIGDHVKVAYTADPTSKNDGPMQLGYENSRFSITCSDGEFKECVLEVQQDGKDKVVRFPYVEQEWFNPEHTNRPWHTLDVIYSLPSYNGNVDLHFTRDPSQNRILIEVMTRNGWVK